MSVLLRHETVAAPAQAGTFKDMKFALDLQGYPTARIIHFESTVAAPEGASDGTHRLSISLTLPNLPNAQIVFAQADAPYGDDLNIYGSRPSTELYEQTPTFPKSDAAWVQAISNMHVGPDTLFVVRYTNLTDADQTGDWLMRITYVLGQ